MTISRFITVPAFATFSLALSLALLPIKAEAPHSKTIAAAMVVNPA